MFSTPRRPVTGRRLGRDENCTPKCKIGSANNDMRVTRLHGWGSRQARANFREPMLLFRAPRSHALEHLTHEFAWSIYVVYHHC